MTEVLRTWADDAADFARELACQDARWGSGTWQWAGGRLVLCGAGMFVNRAIAAGWHRPPTRREFEWLQRRAVAVGVAPSIEVTPRTHAEVSGIVVERGDELPGEASVLRRSLVDVDVGGDLGDSDGEVEIAAGALHDWQKVSASVWGRESTSGRRASDAFARAARARGDKLLIARRTGRNVGCATLSIRARVATLGAMSTLPDERGRGVRSAMIRFRSELVGRAGCTRAVSAVAPHASSERNLVRGGFEPWFTIATVSRSARREGR